MRKYRYLPPILIICTVLAISILKNLQSTARTYSHSRLMMDTLIEISVWGDGKVSREAAVDSAFAVIAGIESLLGDGIVDATTQPAIVNSDEFQRVLAVSQTVYALTGGLFDPTIGSVSRLWHFWEEERLPSPDSLRTALADVGFGDYLSGSSRRHFVFDLGGVAKGYAAELAAAKLRGLGIKSAIVNAGGELRLLGSRPDGKPWRIAIRHPRKPGAFAGYLDVENVAVATSGDYERCFFLDGKRYHHILDPRTGMPSCASVSVTVVAQDAALADAMATGLFLLGPRDGLALIEREQGIDAVFVYMEGDSLAVSPRLSGRFKRPEVE